MAKINIPVLVVDDYTTMRRIIRNLLEQLGFSDIDEAENGQQALGKLRARAFGLVISDWNMSVMSGLELLKAVRADARLKGLPFIMVTAEGKADNVLAAKAAGVNQYIAKPFTPDVFSRKIESVLGVKV